MNRLCPLCKKTVAPPPSQMSEKPPAVPSSSPLLHFLVCFCYTTSLTSFPLISKPKTCAFSHLAQGMLTLALLLVTLLRPDSPCVSLQLLVYGQMDHRLLDSVCRGSRLLCFIHLVCVGGSFQGRIQCAQCYCYSSIERQNGLNLGDSMCFMEKKKWLISLS